MADTRAEIQRTLDKQPKETSLENARYQRYVLQKIERGLEDSRTGQTLSEEAFDQRMAEWLVKRD